MFEKVANDAYVEGALLAVQQLEASSSIKEAALDLLLKESEPKNKKNKSLRRQAKMKKRKAKRQGRGVSNKELYRRANQSQAAKKTVVAKPPAAAPSKFRGAMKYLGGLSGKQKALGALGALAAGSGIAYGAGAFDGPEPEGFDALTPAQQAAIIGGGAAAVGGAGYGLSQIM
tara:strand:- start:2155 stop:2673 length:519 start_codon:yes stop_codon:yes gene_type:complete